MNTLKSEKQLLEETNREFLARLEPKITGVFYLGSNSKAYPGTLGERETVARAARRILSSFVDWEVLERSAKRGNYEGISPRKVTHRRLVAWLMESVLISSSSSSGSLKAIALAPSLFPFRIKSQ